MSPHQAATRVMSTIIVLLGLGILISTVVRSGISFSYGVLVGVLFVIAGVGRLWVSTKKDL